MTACRNCGEQIEWLKTRSGKNIPVAPESVTKGDSIFEPAQHVAHWDNCRGQVKRNTTPEVKVDYKDPTYIKGSLP